MPLDVAKTRLQLQGPAAASSAAQAASGGSAARYTGMLHAIRQILATEGAAALWSGIAPALVRQATYGSARIGMYEPIKGAIGTAAGRPAGAAPGFADKLLAGTLSGALASAAFNPTDRVKVLLQAGAPGSEAGALGALRGVLAREGPSGLYRGWGPTAARAALVASAELATYDEFKGLLTSPALLGMRRDSTLTHLAASGLAGVVATVVSSPADVIKSRVMGRPDLYPGVLAALTATLREEGPAGLYRGFVPNATRIVPHVCISFVVIERLRYAFGVDRE